MNRRTLLASLAALVLSPWKLLAGSQPVIATNIEEYDFDGMTFQMRGYHDFVVAGADVCQKGISIALPHGWDVELLPLDDIKT